MIDELRETLIIIFPRNKQKKRKKKKKRKERETDLLGESFFNKWRQTDVELNKTWEVFFQGRTDEITSADSYIRKAYPGK